jgi:transcriptional regulator with GAF, ATPase, and Fis domain
VTPIPGVVGVSRAMRRAAVLVRTAAASDITVLIEGETGTGKELVARAIALLGARRAQPFVAVNCGAVSESMLDAELFGHRHGAFTGATGDRRGLLESAHGGTVFLDEITSMSASFQARLLRVLENAEIRPVGCDRTRSVDLRVVAASNAPLVEAVRRGEFRADLFYRLRVFPIALPPLRERREDIPALIDLFLAAGRKPGCAAAPALSAEARVCLLRYDYPGNVRELKNEIARAAALAAGACIDLEHLSLEMRAAATRTAPPIAASRVVSLPSPAGAMPAGDRDVVPGALERQRVTALTEVERRLVLEALERHDYNVSRAATALALSRFGLRKRMRRLGLSVKRSLASVAVPAPLGEVAP